jgi:hypothetical protein
MTKAEIIEVVGRDVFEAASENLRLEAADPAYGGVLSSPRLPASDLPHRIADLIWDGPDSWAEKIRLLFDVYDEMPGYGHLMYVTHHYEHFSASDRSLWWHKVAERLEAAVPAIASPIEYSLWCDFFENPDRVTEAWRHLTQGNPSEGTLRAVLRASGPVPYVMKTRLYEQLITDPKWHEWILESLRASASDVYGDIDRRDARTCSIACSCQRRGKSMTSRRCWTGRAAVDAAA